MRGQKAAPHSWYWPSALSCSSNKANIFRPIPTPVKLAAIYQKERRNWYPAPPLGVAWTPGVLEPIGPEQSCWLRSFSLAERGEWLAAGPIIGPEHACTERGKGPPQVQGRESLQQSGCQGQGTRAAPLEGLVASERWESEQSWARKLGAASLCGSVSGVSWRKPGWGGGGDWLIQGAEAEDPISQTGCQDDGEDARWMCRRALTKGFNQVPFDDDENESCVRGNDSFLCSRFSSVKM